MCLLRTLMMWRRMTGRAGFDSAREALGSTVESLEIDVMELAPERVGGTFDVVLFLGVLYHMRDPMLALERAASVTGERMILETHLDVLDVARPAMAFYPFDELAGDASNWVGPNLLGSKPCCGPLVFVRYWSASRPPLPGPVPASYAHHAGHRSAIVR